jgi:hypothetical protein
MRSKSCPYLCAARVWADVSSARCRHGIGGPDAADVGLGQFAPGCDIPGLHELLTGNTAGAAGGHGGGAAKSQMLTPAQQEMLFNLAMAQSQSAGFGRGGSEASRTAGAFGGFGAEGDGGAARIAGAMPVFQSTDSTFETHGTHCGGAGGSIAHFAPPAARLHPNFNFGPAS